MADLVRLLSSLVDERSNVKLAGFYDSVRPLEADEKTIYDELFARLEVFVVAAVDHADLAATSPSASAGRCTTANRS